MEVTKQETSQSNKFQPSIPPQFSGTLIEGLVSTVEKVESPAHTHICIGCGAKLECDCDYPADLNVCRECDCEVRR